jgi:hypothetical protein
MSKLLAALKTGAKWKWVKVERRVDDFSQAGSIVDIHTVRLMFEAEIIADKHPGFIGLHNMAFDRATRAIQENIVGEFREPFAEVRRALYNRDIRELTEQLDRLERLLFTDYCEESK